ncbi:hypothetical protein [Achromobacter xylosoxidans]|uniref:hypothetical protein n=1 Tax=Alcaligenes xylosoxydans xylosoxydans TaxID=85698 RepID=UPI0006C59747|nr:hypothetical protein [Achromobacter xylosoxidans]MCH1990895.1 phage tail protein [Achromobacter xylosoxidans]MCH1997807.1 phage tail protein [Achromobacter xylosoxidans]MCH4590448.1 phage tail protein [Achromobacter xylosoxidans]MDH0545846.1 phage tail protein [Achromobacter xylosoxidans]CUI71171.1 Uncharacterised protein [Achromobacter xylosoxidans]
MNKKTVYQTNNDGLFLYETEANELALSPGAFNIPFGAVEAAPPKSQAHQVARYTGKKWEIVEDHRRSILNVVATGERYVIGQVVQLDDKPHVFPGWGPVPEWLSVASTPR